MLKARLTRHSEKHRLFANNGYEGPVSQMAAAFLLDFALVSNPMGVVLLSLYKPEHLDFALKRVTTLSRPQSVVSLGEQISNLEVST